MTTIRPFSKSLVLYWAASVACTASLGGASALALQPAGEPPVAPSATVPEVSPAESVQDAPAKSVYKDAAALLGALETADKDLVTLFADMEYVKTLSDLQGGDQQVHRGKLRYFVRPVQAVPGAAPGAPLPKARRGFAVTFDKMIAGGREDEENRQFIFDGEWFVERDLKNKQFVKRRVVAAGEQADPLKIGEGPFPVPIGQAKKDILARFEAVLVPALEAVSAEEIARFPKLAETYQIKLTPRSGTIEAKSFAELRLWYRTSDLLPRLARSTAPDGSVTDVRLINLKRNQPYDPALISIDRPTEPGWVVSIQEELRAETVVKPAAVPEGSGPTPGDAPKPSENAPPEVPRTPPEEKQNPPKGGDVVERAERVLEGRWVEA